MQRVVIIHNPSSGILPVEKLSQQIQEKLSSSYDIEYHISQSFMDLKEYLEKAILTKPFAIIACGGDGTINTIAAKLVNSPIKLGIIPSGSGNGFAKTLGITSIQTAIEKLILGNIKNIDTLMINNQFCCNVAGIGFDAHVAGLFAKEKKRGFWKYLKIVITEYRNKSYPIKIVTPLTTIEKNVLLTSIANSNQWGNNVIINPKGTLTDGKFELICIEPLHFWQIPQVVWCLFQHKIHQHKKVTILETSEATIFADNLPLQIDGEYMGQVSEKIIISLLPASLQIIC